MKKVITGVALSLMVAFSSAYAADDMTNSGHTFQGKQVNGFWLQHDGNEGYTGGYIN